MSPQIDLGRALAHAIDPTLFCADRLGFEPDLWQAKFLRCKALKTGGKTRILEL